MNTPRLSFLFFASAFATVLTTSACDGSNSAPRVKSFTATPANIPSLGGDVLLTWDVRNASEIEIDPLVGVVTGTSASVHVTETTTFTLTAKKKGRSAHKRATVTVSGPTTVVGVVRRALSRDPVANVVVWIKGQGATYTAADGTFSFESVETPYDLAVVDPNNVMTVVYLGVTRMDPNLEIDSPSFIPYTASVTGTISPALPVGSQNVVVADSPTMLPSQTTLAVDSYNLVGAWLTDPTADFALHAYRYTVDTAGNPAAYTGYGRAPITLTNGIAGAVDIALQPVSLTQETTGTATAAGGATVDTLTGFLIFGTPTGTFADEGFFLPPDSSALSGPDGSFSLLSPALSGGLATANLFGRFQITGIDGFANAYAPLTPGSSEVDLDFPAPPRLLTPVDGGSVSRDTVLRSATRDDSVKVFRLAAGFPGPLVVVVTTEKDFVVPDLREIGFDLFLSPGFSWDLYVELAPRNSVDEAMGPDGLSGLSPEWFGFSNTRTLYSTEVP